MAMTPKKDVLQGTLALLVLRTLTRGAMHGYAITSHIARVSSDLLRVEEGSLYPALHRMEQEGWLRSYWGMTDKNREARQRIRRCGTRSRDRSPARGAPGGRD